MLEPPLKIGDKMIVMNEIDVAEEEMMSEICSDPSCAYVTSFNGRTVAARSRIESVGAEGDNRRTQSGNGD